MPGLEEDKAKPWCAGRWSWAIDRWWLRSPGSVLDLATPEANRQVDELQDARSGSFVFLAMSFVFLAMSSFRVGVGPGTTVYDRQGRSENLGIRRAVPGRHGL